MAGAFDLAKQVLQLVANVDRLISDVEKLQKMVWDQEKRIIHLEASGNALSELARRVAMEEVLKYHLQVSSKLDSAKRGAMKLAAPRGGDAAKGGD